jgi:hypothetical protein
MALPVLSHFKHRGKNPRLDFWIGRRGGCVVSSLGKSPRWLVESSVHQLESVMATANRVSFHIADNASWSMPDWVGSRHSLAKFRRFWAVGALACIFPELESVL